MKFIVEYDKKNKNAFNEFCISYVTQLKEFIESVENDNSITYSLELPVFTNSTKSKERHSIIVKNNKEKTLDEKRFDDIWNSGSFHN